MLILFSQNVLGGALFSPAFATIILTALTTIGSACATLLSTPLAPFLMHMFPRALDMTRSALGAESHPSNQSKPKTATWVRLSVLRLIGVVPWSGINIACGVCGVSLRDCILGTFIGCLPWTAVTCQVLYISPGENNYLHVLMTSDRGHSTNCCFNSVTHAPNHLIAVDNT